MSTPRIGLFGGTFDPPHLGHVAALRAAAHTGRFDAIVVTVAGDPYQKSSARLVRSGQERLDLSHAAFDGLELVSVSDLELRRSGPSYTVDTVKELLVDAASVDVLVGADAAATMSRWHGASELATLSRVGIFPRPGVAVIGPEGFDWYEIPMELIEISSTNIRANIGNEAHLAETVPDKVIPMLGAPTE
jgi:nicotinate-nucleotide adenylyltransferase